MALNLDRPNHKMQYKLPEPQAANQANFITARLERVLTALLVKQRYGTEQNFPNSSTHNLTQVCFLAATEFQIIM